MAFSVLAPDNRFVIWPPDFHFKCRLSVFAGPLDVEFAFTFSSYLYTVCS